jgi:hypothetical protein
VDLIEQLIQYFRHFVEEVNGWELLWDGNRPKGERAAQRLFQAVVKYACESNGIVLDPEPNLGRGPVDFKFSKDYARRVLVELKKVVSSHFWHGLEVQLVSYCKSDKCPDAWYVAIAFASGKTGTATEVSRLAKLPEKVVEVSRREKLNIRHQVIHAAKRPSASHIPRGQKSVRGNKQ